jgi:site-specific DNA recombinase
MNKKTLGCAIYTRNACSRGHEQDSDSLNAQRKLAENYIADQNWQLLLKHYDDDGYSGSNMNRPALQELFNDIRNGLVDTVVVDRPHRLSRSVFDFVEIMEFFEKHNVVFISAIQELNTSTSSGKLMLGKLREFVHHERMRMKLFNTKQTQSLA